MKFKELWIEVEKLSFEEKSELDKLLTVRPRTIVLGIVKNSEGHILAFPGYDKKNGVKFYRPLGGGINYGETSEIAMKREFQEEIGEEVTNLRLLGVMENIFTFKEKVGHEIVFGYECEFVNKGLYSKESIQVIALGGYGELVWVNIEKEIENGAKIYPKPLYDLYSKDLKK